MRRAVTSERRGRLVGGGGGAVGGGGVGWCVCVCVGVLSGECAVSWFDV